MNTLAQRLAKLSLFVIVLLAVAVLVDERSAPAREIHLAPHPAMPQFVLNAAPDAQHAYRFAAANPHLLHDMPCYCGCVYMGHRDNLDCYIKEAKTPETIVFDNHAVNCGICIEITLDVMQRWEAGEHPDDIYAAIVETYSQRGPSTEESV